MSSDSLIHAASGAAGGVISMALTYPLIAISTRAQVETSKHPEESLREAVLKIVKKEGLTGLYAGLNSSLVGIAVTNGVYYLFYEQSRDIILKAKSKRTPLAGMTLTTLESILAGLVAGTATTVISNPIWVINTRQTVRVHPHSPKQLPTTTKDANGVQTQKQKGQVKKLGFFETIAHILKTDGPGAFWRGLGPALVLVVNPILQYTVFEQLKNRLLARRLSKLQGKVPAGVPLLSDLDFFMLGAISKLVATSATYPHIVVKSRMQSGQAVGRSYKNAFHGVASIFQAEGLRGLYRGVGSKLLQSVLTAAILFMMKEKTYVWAKKLLAPVASAAAGTNRSH